MDPLLEKELELAAQRQGVSKSQFIISAVERALGRRNAYELMVELQAQEPALIAAEPASATVSERPQVRAAPSPPPAGVKETWNGPAFPCEQPYAPEAAKAALRRKLKVKHDVGGAG
jgi:RHH-type rel operon transcriptional repressor/antitoxin RelB